MTSIHFFKEDCLIDLRKIQSYKKWVSRVATSHQFSISELNYIFCSDEYLYQMNVDYLSHDTYTDIITFDLSDKNSNNTSIEADIFVSIERVKENAKQIGVDFYQELARVMAHGVLHLIGYQDKFEEDKKKMRAAEDYALSFLK